MYVNLEITSDMINVSSHRHHRQRINRFGPLTVVESVFINVLMLKPSMTSKHIC